MAPRRKTLLSYDYDDDVEGINWAYSCAMHCKVSTYGISHVEGVEILIFRDFIYESFQHVFVDENMLKISILYTYLKSRASNISNRKVWN
jgi:hypothetical protein